MPEYITPLNLKMREEFLQRQKVRQILGSWLGSAIVGQETMQLLADTGLSYSQVYRKTNLWNDRVKKALDAV